MRDVSCRDDKVEKFLLQMVFLIVQFGKLHSPGRERRRIVRQDHGLRLDLQMVMFGKNVELMHPVSKRIAIGSPARNRIGEKTERQAALRLVVDGAQTDLVVALRNRT